MLNILYILVSTEESDLIYLLSILIGAASDAYLLRIQEIKPATDQVRTGYGPDTEEVRKGIYFRKSARMGAKQSIKTPGSKQTQPCNMSGSI